MSGRLRRGIGQTIRRVPTATRGILALTLTRRIVAASGAVYLLLYLSVIGDLSVHPGARGVSLLIVNRWAELLTKTAGPFYYEPIARVEFHAITLLVSPLNVAIGALLGGLVGLNTAFAYVALRMPRACRRPESGALGVLATLPGLLSGSACCAPVVLLLLGIPASGLLISLFGILLPLSILLLLLGLMLVAREIDPTQLRKNIEGNTDADPTAIE